MAEKTVGGVIRFTLWGRNENGIAIGNNTTTPADDTTSHAFSKKMVNNVTFEVGDITRVPFLGADREQTHMQFGTSELFGATATLDSIPEDLIVFLGGTTIDITTNSELPVWTNRVDGVTATNVGCMITSRAQTLAGVVKYQNIIFPNATVTVTLGDLGYQSKQISEFNITAASSQVDIGGLALSTYAMAVPDGEMTAYIVNSDNPLAITSYIADGIETTYILQYKPVSSVVAVNAAPNQQWIETVLTAPTSVATATGIVTLVGAGSASDELVMMYETQFVPV
jgi:hypothetical protein